MKSHSQSRQTPTETVKAGALLCPTCCVEYLEIKGDFEFDGAVIKDVAMLKCPVCQEEIFTPEQQRRIQENKDNTS
ncbi:MAG: hypothetical protein NWF04_09925 [Candidatus Bathyarchaeota archaeon]|nr:hypothetical protein [Candidatus Bathyarchaeota archaeon]